MPIERNETVAGVSATDDRPAYVAPQLKTLDGSETASGGAQDTYEATFYYNNPNPPGS
jgi:hypothetical protein